MALLRLDSQILPLYLAYALQSVAQAMSWQFITYFVNVDLGEGSFLILAVVYAVPALVTTLAVYIWGSVSDRLARRRPFMVVGFVGYSMTFLLYSIVENSVQFLTVASVGAVISAAAIPVGQAYLTTGTQRRGEALGYFIVAQSAGWSVGAFSSGFLYDILGMRVIYIIASTLAITAAMICAVAVRERQIQRRNDRQNGSSLTRILRRPGMVRLMLAAGLSSLGNYAVSYMLMYIVVIELMGEEYFVGMANGIATLSAVVLTGLVGRIADRKGPAKILIFAYGWYMFYALALAITTDPVIAAALYAEPIYPFAVTGALTFAALVSDEEERGSAMGLINGAQNAGGALGPIVGALFSEFVFGRRAQPASWLNMIFNLAALMIALTLLSVSRRSVSGEAGATASAITQRRSEE